MRNLYLSSKEKIIELLEKIIEGMTYTLMFYTHLYSKHEITLLKDCLSIMSRQLELIKIDNYTNEDILKIFELEQKLKPLVLRTWQQEFNRNAEVISYFTRDKLSDTPEVVSATYGDSEPFCNGRYGIVYEVNTNGFLGAYSLDAATVLEPVDRRSIYTIGEINGKIVNAYNLITPIVTPTQVTKKVFNDYSSKHNEIILDSRFIKPIKVIYTNENDLDMVNLISKKYQIPIEFQSERKK